MQVVRYPLLPVGSVHFLSDSAIVAAGMNIIIITLLLFHLWGGLKSWRMETNHYPLFFVSHHRL